MAENADITAHLARWSQSLLAIAQTGLNFSNNPYDVERFEEILKLAAEMTATINPAGQLNPPLAAQLEALWRRQVETDFKGYITPNVSVGAIVFNDQDEILLVYSALADYWVFPVGNADVGYTAAEVAQKETREESGLDVTPLQLMAVNDSFRQGFNRTVHVYNLLFYCRLEGGTLGPQTVEIREAGFFKREHLPPSLVADGEPPWVKRAFDWHFGISRQVYFD